MKVRNNLCYIVCKQLYYARKKSFPFNKVGICCKTDGDNKKYLQMSVRGVARNNIKTSYIKMLVSVGSHKVVALLH